MPTRPNILLLQGEDVGSHLGCYSDPNACTPHLDQLAADGARFSHAFTHAPVCAPSRGGMMTGCYPWSIGNHHMRSQLINPPRCYTQELRAAGYHVSWPTKLDFNFTPQAGWCDDQENWWEKPAPDKPFFLYRNFGETHESRMFPDGVGPAPIPPEFHVTDLDSLILPPVYPDCPELRSQLSRYYDALHHLDAQVGQCLQWLQDQGKADNTLVVFLSDHGRGLPREKRWLYDAGVHLPLIVRWPGMLEPGRVDHRLVAWVDIAPTLLSLAGVSIPDHYQGQVFLGEHQGPARNYVYFGRDRMDEVFDQCRGARDHRWHYIRNDFPGLPWARRQKYMEQQKLMSRMRSFQREGRLSQDAGVFFADQKPAEELYDAENDPWMLGNLANDPAHQETLGRLRRALTDQLNRTGDLGDVDEKQLIRRGIIVDQLDEYRSRQGPLPDGSYFGPCPIPLTRSEAMAQGGIAERYS